MVRWIRSVNIKGGRYMEAIGWAKEMAAYSEKNFGLKTHVFLDSFGDVSTIRWMIDGADLATMEKAQDKLMADMDYFKRVAQAFANGLFVDGSTVDVISREI